MGLGWIARVFAPRAEEAQPLYAAVVARAREPHWYVDGAVPDSVDGRFDMVAAMLALVLLRFESEPAMAAVSARLAERFVDDMDGQLRELGVGDVTVGKHIGRMMSMLGGRLGAYREGLAAGDLSPALLRNLYRGAPPADAALRHVADALHRWREALAATPSAALTQGLVP